MTVDLNKLVEKGFLDEVAIAVLSYMFSILLDNVEDIVSKCEEQGFVKPHQKEDLIANLHTGKAMVEVLRYFEGDSKYQKESLRLNKAQGFLFNMYI